MKTIILIGILLLLCFNYALSQKKYIDTAACNNWELFDGDEAISNNGKYVIYRYGSNGVDGNQIMTLALFSIDMGFTWKFPGGSNGRFTSDNRYLYAKLPHDTLMKMDLKSGEIYYQSNISSFSIVRVEGSESICLFSKKDSLCTLLESRSGKSNTYKHIVTYNLSKSGKYLLLQSPSGTTLIETRNGVEKKISSCVKIQSVTWSDLETELAFICDSSRGSKIKYYKIGMDSSVYINPNYNKDLQYHLYETNRIEFSKSGNLLYTYARIGQNSQDNLYGDTQDVTIWNYKDKYLTPQQIQNLQTFKSKTYLTAINLKTNILIPLESNKEEVIEFKKNDRYLLTRNIINSNESYWNGDSTEIYLVDLNNGRRKSIVKNIEEKVLLPQLSFSENFTVWFDKEEKSWMSYQNATGVTKNIGKGIGKYMYEKIPGNIFDYIASDPIEWTNRDSSLLLKDRFDLWEIDPLGKKAPVNLTNGYGRKNNISFYNLNLNIKKFNGKEVMLLAGFNTETKANGFWTIDLGGKGIDPKQSSMGSYIYYYPKFQGVVPKKANDTSVYLVRRLSASEAPNLFITKDFVSFLPVTNIQPQKKYNWLTSELIRWKLPNKVYTKGILYKPENFNPEKKYPLIFSYYEQRSDELNLYIRPELQNARINVPWFVSRGYLVCIPDMYFIKGHNGQGVVSTITAAVEYLKQFSWVDINKLGLQGHSFGGYETNFLVTHTNVFAAAQEMAGQSNLISGYGGLSLKGGISRQSLYEKSQSNIPCPPWVCPDLYIENSPVFGIGNATTPLFMIHNKNDNAVPYAQAVELFTGLRRAGKKVWLVEYDSEGHVILNYKNKLDLTIRTQQFFDHYLKGKPAPQWMTRSTLPEYKQIDNGLELDTSGIRP